MMILAFKPELRGRVEIPASKSISNRALFINALVEKPCSIENLAECDDVAAMLRVVGGEVANTVSEAISRKRNTTKPSMCPKSSAR